MPLVSTAAEIAALRVRPAEDVREAEVAERVLRVAPVEAEQLGAEHEAVAEARREARARSRSPGVTAPSSAVADRVGSITRTPSSSPPQRMISKKRESSLAVVTRLPAGTTPVTEAGVVRDLDQLVERRAQRARQEVRQRGQRGRPGQVVERDLRRCPLARRRSWSSGSRAGRGTPRPGRRGCPCP